jgi:hypothetical protein
MKTKTSFDARLTTPCFGAMEVAVRMAAADHMVPTAEYVRRAIAAQLAKDGYLPREIETRHTARGSAISLIRSPRTRGGPPRPEP